MDLVDTKWYTLAIHFDNKKDSHTTEDQHLNMLSYKDVKPNKNSIGTVIFLH